MIVTIQSGNVSAQIDSFGGQLLSFEKDGKEYIWQRNPAYWNSCAPILFPVVGRLRNKVLSVKGRDYPMTMHGFVRDFELEVTDRQAHSVTFRLTGSDKTRALYPWNFCFEVTFTLEGDKLTCGFRVENRDSEEMLFCLGGHPGFNVPMAAGEAFEDYQLEFEKEEILESNHVNEDEAISASRKDAVLDSGRILPLERSLFNNDAMIFEDIQSKWVNLVSRETGKGIHFAYPGFPILAVWTKGEPLDAPYVCLEPWFGMGFRDDEGTALEQKYGVQHLAPGGVFTAAFSAEIID